MKGGTLITIGTVLLLLLIVYSVYMRKKTTMANPTLSLPKKYKVGTDVIMSTTTQTPAQNAAANVSNQQGIDI